MPPCPTPNVCWVYLIRHGATANNRARPPRLQGRGLDAELSPAGLQQARLTADFLAPCPVNALYSSPLRRARQTAQPIAERHQLPIQIADELAEVDVGRWEGMTWEQVERQYPAEHKAFLSDAGVHPYLGGETLEDVRARAVPALHRIMEENVGRTVAVVAHNVVNRTYLANLMELPLSMYRAIPQDNCGITLLRYRDGRTRIVTINGTFHLDGTWNSG